MNGATVVATTNAAINLNPYEATLVTIGTGNCALGANAYNAVIATC